MNLRNFLGVTAGTVGATAIANRLLSARAKDFEPFHSSDRGTYRWRGFDVSYAELGNPSNQDLIMLHGINIAASGHEFWAVSEALAKEYHVIVPDLPGFGHSDRPALFYSASLYCTFVADFLDDITDEPPIVVASSLTGSYAAIAARDVELEQLVLICPSDGVAGKRRRWLRVLLRAPITGQAVFNVIASKPSIRHFYADHGLSDRSRLPDEVLDYDWTAAHQAGARFAPASFLAGYLDPEEDLADVLTDLEEPVTLIWGRNADTVPLEWGRDVAKRGNARLVVVDETKLLPHVEHPNLFSDVLEDSFRVLA